MNRPASHPDSQSKKFIDTATVKAPSFRTSCGQPDGMNTSSPAARVCKGVVKVRHVLVWATEWQRAASH